MAVRIRAGRTVVGVYALIVLVVTSLWAADVTTAGPATVPGARIAGVRPVVHLRVLPLGASSTEGIGSPGTAGYRGPLYTMLRRDGVAVDFVGSLSRGPSTLADRDHEGHSGWTITMLAPRVARWLRDSRPEVILLHAGTNDLGRGASGAVVADRLDDLLSRIYAQAPAAHVIVAGVWAPMPRARAARADLAARTPRVVARHRVLGRSISFVDTSDLLRPTEFTDGLHPNAAGYRRIARMFRGEIERWLATRAGPAAPGPAL
ncbi:GDSL-type esterase/lipase family protein [Pseudonocardia hispaniensis]|uniref:GDSL-type esterase/lipase family protein n=1 Tax=Pseudonocardia hispaniensis TaxID=904933 RepID=A0ABW1IWB4_9PSEU